MIIYNFSQNGVKNYDVFMVKKYIKIISHFNVFTFFYFFYRTIMKKRFLRQIGRKAKSGMMYLSSFLIILNSVIPAVPVFADNEEPTSNTCTTDKAACIGEVWYDTLAAAVAAVAAEGIVTLNKDITITSGITVNKKFTLNLWEHKITGGVTAFSVVAGWDLTINATNENWWIKNTAWGVITISNGWKVTINEWKFEWTSTVIWVVWEWSVLTVNDWFITWGETWNKAAVHVRRRATANIHGWDFIWKAGTPLANDNLKTMKAVYAGWEWNYCERAGKSCTPTSQTDFVNCPAMEWWTINIDGGHFEWRMSLSNWWVYNITWWTFKLTEVAGIDCDYVNCSTGWKNNGVCMYWTLADMLWAWYTTETIGNEGELSVVADNTQYTVIYTDWVDWEELFANQTTTNLLINTSTPEFVWTPSGLWYVFLSRTPTVSAKVVAADATEGVITYTATWNCDTNYHDDNGLCVSEKSWACTDPEDKKPNADYTSTWEYTWDGNAWIAPTCTLIWCSEWYHDDNWACVLNNKLVEIDPSTTANISWTTTPISMGTINIINTWDDLSWNSGDIVLVQSTNPTDTPEWSENQLENQLTQDLVQELSWNTSKKVDVQWILDIKFIQLLSSGVNLISAPITFTTPIKVRIKVNQRVKFKVKHNWSTGYNFDLLANSSSADCNNLGNDAYTWRFIDPDGSWYAEIWTCGASTFVAYTETINIAPSSSSSSSYHGWNTTATTETWAAVDTWDTADTESNSTDNLDPKEVLANGFTREFNDAYEFAFANGITTMKTIQEAAMEDGLNRIAMAKMLSQYAINVLGKTPADVEVPNFVDVSADLDAEYANWVTLAYKLWIMWINMPNNEFLPFESVTRAQFGTALSRLIFGIEDGEDAYYTTHLAKLKEAGIISNDDPTLEELRWYVMLMLMRSAK